MRVCLVCYENPDEWILGKFARRMHEQLIAMGVESEITRAADKNADINHHINYSYYDGKRSSLDTVMVTHVDALQKLQELKGQLTSAEMGVCMSRQTMEQLASAGVPRHRLCFVNPAHDEVIRPRALTVGITTRRYADGRKKELALLAVCDKVSPEDFAFSITGDGWQQIVDEMRGKGFTVAYEPQFDYDKYVAMIRSLDYFAYFGEDEGSMGFVDALAAGVKTIVTPQGYHLDVEGGITHAVNNEREIVNAFQVIARERRKRIDGVRSWTWANYTRQHVEIWGYLLAQRSTAYRLAHVRSDESGGLASVAEPDGGARSRPGTRLRYLLKPLTLKLFLARLAPPAIRRYMLKRIQPR
jgi:hypothetical protein